MPNCKPSHTPVDTQSKFGLNGPPATDPTLYRSLAAALQYLTFTHPDLTYDVQQLCIYMHYPREHNFDALKRVLRYLRGYVHNRLQLFASSTTKLTTYSDADWGAYPGTYRSTSGYCVFRGDDLLSCSSKRQTTISRSSAEAEYRAVAKYIFPPTRVQHQYTRHIEIDIHFVRDLVATGAVRVLHVPSSSQYADIFTKGLPTQLFNDFKFNVESYQRMIMGPTINVLEFAEVISMTQRMNKYSRFTRLAIKDSLFDLVEVTDPGPINIYVSANVSNLYSSKL
ncbi:uncharacterized mitochondrial protein AtMg00810-like [Rutidosis leptorrhynchoides]|uniref:uncharacterized mitochondrial protein AtMg00810-like n=1 Tax=Rutidosis leptorrhynchoides TaxID=125765 RepID=UPI003A994B56